jgi:hypothetical protein
LTTLRFFFCSVSEIAVDGGFFSPDLVFFVVYWRCPYAGRQSLSLLLQRK